MKTYSQDIYYKLKTYSQDIFSLLLKTYNIRHIHKTYSVAKTYSQDIFSTQDIFTRHIHKTP